MRIASTAMFILTVFYALFTLYSTNASTRPQFILINIPFQHEKEIRDALDAVTRRVREHNFEMTGRFKNELRHLLSGRYPIYISWDRNDACADSRRRRREPISTYVNYQFSYSHEFSLACTSEEMIFINHTLLNDEMLIETTITPIPAGAVYKTKYKIFPKANLAHTLLHELIHLSSVYLYDAGKGRSERIQQLSDEEEWAERTASHYFPKKPPEWIFPETKQATQP